MKRNVVGVLESDVIMINAYCITRTKTCPPLLFITNTSTQHATRSHTHSYTPQGASGVEAHFFSSPPAHTHTHTTMAKRGGGNGGSSSSIKNKTNKGAEGPHPQGAEDLTDIYRQTTVARALAEALAELGDTEQIPDQVVDDTMKAFDEVSRACACMRVSLSRWGCIRYISRWGCIRYIST